MTVEYTKYERARILGARALQISMGAPVLIETETRDPIEIAAEELERGAINITVRGKAAPLQGAESE